MNSSIIVYWYSFLSSFPITTNFTCFNSGTLLAAHILTANSAAKLPNVYLVLLHIPYAFSMEYTYSGFHPPRSLQLFNFQRSFHLLLNSPPCIIETKQNVSLSFADFYDLLTFPNYLPPFWLFFLFSYRI